MLQAVRWVTDYLAILEVFIIPVYYYLISGPAGAGSGVGGINPEE
jgi:hypothetical protein